MAMLINSTARPSVRNLASASAPKVAGWLTCVASTIESPNRPTRNAPAGFARWRSTSRRPSELRRTGVRFSRTEMPAAFGVAAKPIFLSG